MSRIQEIAIVNLERRASAAQMLVKCYNRVDLALHGIRSQPLPAQLPLLELQPKPEHLLLSQLELHKLNQGCKRMQIYSQPLPSSVSGKLKHNPFAGYKSFAGNHRLRVELLYFH